MKVLGDISNGDIRKITWASYGSHPDSWFFAYELRSGLSTFCVGSAIPAALRQFIDKISHIAYLCSTLRVQLGDNDSFVAWTKTSWACCGIPKALEAELCQLSWTHMRSATLTRGSFKDMVSQIVWHGDGSYYVASRERHDWNFASGITCQAWNELWRRPPTPKELSELVVRFTPGSITLADANAL